jgi:hypothetical protein
MEIAERQIKRDDMNARREDTQEIAADRPAEGVRRHGNKARKGLWLVGLICLHSFTTQAQVSDMLIDNFTNSDLVSNLGTRWRGVSDQVMGGISEASVTHDIIDDLPCLRLRGDVRLENNGGFIQASLDLAPAGENIDASAYTGLRLTVRGNGEQYSVHLRTPDNVRPWQSYRAQFTAGLDWATIDLPFASFVPYRLDAPLDTTRLKRIGLVAIGRVFNADLVVSELSFYR